MGFFQTNFGYAPLIKYVLVLILGICITACGERPNAVNGSPISDTSMGGASSDSKASSILVSSEDVVVVNRSLFAFGASITGSIQPERQADLRAEISAVVLEVIKDNGDVVQRGDLLLRLDRTSIRDNVDSAMAAEHASNLAYKNAERQMQRLIKLRNSGLVSMQVVEDAEVQRDNALSNLEATKSHLIQAQQQLRRTEVRAPFDGVISNRKVSTGDTVQIGKELLKVIDPQSMRFEGMVSAENIDEISMGQRVHFRVHGYEPDFTGEIMRVSPSANTSTRQVEVLVKFLDADELPKLAGLYAEGRIEGSNAPGITIPATALVINGEQFFAWRISDNLLRKVRLTVDSRDSRSGDFVLKSGLSIGDILLRYPSINLVDGQRIEWSAAPTPIYSSAR